jgi:hypothetical protein
MCREQKTKEREHDFGCPAGDRVEPEAPEGARSIETPEAAAVGGAELLGKVLSVDNMFDACERVVRNLPRASGLLSRRSRRDDGGGTATVPYQTVPGTM